MNGIVLLLTSIVSFVAAGMVSYAGGDQASYFIKLSALTFLSFVTLAFYFIGNPRFQGFFSIKPSKKLLVTFSLLGLLFSLAINFLFFGRYKNYLACIDLDSISYITQAKIFSTGNLSVPSHELKEFFTTGYFINDGKFYSKYFPGWPFLLAAGVIAGIPWAINPLFGLMTVFMVYMIGKETHDSNTGLFASMILLFSQNSYYLNTSYLSEPSNLFFSCLFFYFAVKYLKEPRVLYSSLSGISLGMAFLIRPYSGIAIALPVMLYLSYRVIKEWKKMVFSFLVMGASFLPAVLMLLAYNHFQTGSMFFNPFEYYNPYDKLGFGMRSLDVFVSPTPYTPIVALKNLTINMGILNIMGILFLFVFGYFLVVGVKNDWDFLIIATVLSIIVFHFFYHAKSSRYYHSALFAMALLAARGMILSEAELKKYFPGKSIKNMSCFFLSYVMIVSVFVTISPLKIYNRYKIQNLYRDPFSLVEKENLRNSVIFVKSVPERYNNTSMYIQNPLYFKGNILFARDLESRNNELMRYYPDRTFYVYQYDRKSRTGKLTPLQ